MYSQFMMHGQKNIKLYYCWVNLASKNSYKCEPPAATLRCQIIQSDHILTHFLATRK